jgi:hypothetical protein
VATKTPVPATKNKPPWRRRNSTAAVLAITHAVLVGVAAVFAVTHSVPVVLIAAGAAVLLVGLAVIRG